MQNKKIIIPAIALGLVIFGASLYGASALAFGGPSDEERASRAQELANKLGVDKDKVATAINEIRAEKQQARVAEVSSKLDEAVKDGVITSEQKQKILDKQAEIRGQRGQKRAEMKQWYEDNDIDFDKVHDYIGLGGGTGRGQRSCSCNNS